METGDVDEAHEQRRRSGRVDDAVYRTAFEVSPLPICLFDMDGRYLRVNAAFCELVGAHVEDVLGKHVSEFNVPEENADAARNLRALRSGEPESRQVHRRLRATDGRVIHVTASVTVVHHDGEPFGILSMVSDVTRHKEVEAELRLLALSDPLTGLGNRQQLEPALRHLERAGRPGAVCFADLDQFKDINDRYGHHVADEVLTSIGIRLQDALGDEDIALRVGGDELVVLRSGVADVADATAFGHQVRDAIAHTVVHDDVHVWVRASVGVAFDPHPDRSLMGRADRAMYEAKRSGRDQVVVLGPPASPAVV